MIKKQGLEFPVVFSGKGAQDPLAQAFGVHSADENELLRAGLPGVPTAGQKTPSLKAWGLDNGSPLDWRPAKDANTLVVFCALWHPQGRRFLQSAAAWAKEHSAHLAAFSVDWYREQAQRELAKLVDAPEVLYAGPSDLGPAAAWHVTLPAQAFLVSPAGKLLPAPKPDEWLGSADDPAESETLKAGRARIPMWSWPPVVAVGIDGRG